MRNITVSISDEGYRQARMWAAENNTSLSAAVEYMLENVRSILSVRKPPRRSRRNNRYTIPPVLKELGCEDMMQFVNQPESRFSIRALYSGTEFVQK